MSQVKVLGELAVLDDVGPARRGRAYPAAGATSALLLPAMVLLGGLVVWPVLRTLHASVTTGGHWVGAAHFRTALAAPDTGAVVGRTVLWAVLVPAVVTALGYLLAAASRRSQEGGLVRLILLVPVALPLVVTGVTFRLMYDPDPTRGLATLVAARLTGRSAEDAPQLLGPGLVTVALMSAFVWAWVGLAVLVFRAALDAVPPSLADAVRAYGGGRRHVLWDAQWRPLLLRTVAVVFALVAVGTSRTFDLILVMTPGSVRDEAAVLALRVWQTSGGTTTGEGAALGVVWLAAVVGGILVAALFVRQAWPPPRAETPPGPDRVAPPRRVFRLLAAGAAVAWLVPLVVLVATSLHGRVDSAARGWWSAPPGLGSYRQMVTGTELWRTLAFTLLLATVVTATVLVVALLAAYPLAWLTGPAAQATGLLLLAASVVPVQVIAGPVNEVLGLVLSSGTARGLALVHVALGVPFAVLVLRNAFADLPAEQVRGARLGGRRWWGTLRRLARHNLPAVVAVSVLEFVQVWNDLVVGLLFSGPEAAPLGHFLAGQTRGFVSNSGLLAASSVLASVLPVVLVVLARRQLVAGLVSGGVR
ncbi:MULTISPECIES: ABC transporter permease subunit [unclassified Micromonospora]|uniref:ABC transporter permease subunit n=1 Tax=unclassified Micromonospora TaxID=2617518 RepID=UPI000EF4A7C0|nr:MULTISPECIES: ABC transporter permease subunit [unclassified Micromonospora]RLP91234.1 ABC transporter permease subunit [Micromonospora sp. BL4]RLP96057.1 ABC transporter permease subunit [Micromonospora sp. CV4]